MRFTIWTKEFPLPTEKCNWPMKNTPFFSFPEKKWHGLIISEFWIKSKNIYLCHLFWNFYPYFSVLVVSSLTKCLTPKAAVIYSKSGTNVKRKNSFKKWCKSILILVQHITEKNMNTSLQFYIYTLQRGCQYPKYFYCYISNGFLDMFLRAT